MDKQRIGERLARAMISLDGQPRWGCLGPSSIRFDNGAAQVVFPAGSGLRNREEGVRGFQLAGADRIWHPAEATLIDGIRVTASSTAVPTPVALRYAWAGDPNATLIDTDGAPVGCFRSDNWPPPTR